MLNRFQKFNIYKLGLALDNPLFKFTKDQRFRIKEEINVQLHYPQIHWNCQLKLSLFVLFRQYKQYLERWQSVKRHFNVYLALNGRPSYNYFLTVNPFKSTSADLLAINSRVNKVLKHDHRCAVWYRKLATAPSYADGGSLDYHLHCKLVATGKLPIYKLKRAIKSTISKFQRQHHERAKSSVDLKPLPTVHDDLKTDDYVASQDVHPFRKATHGNAIGQTEAEIFKNLPLKRQYQLQADQFHDHSAKNYIYWNSSNRLVKLYRLYSKTPQNKDIPMFKTTAQKPRPTFISKHHYSNLESLRQFYGLDIYTGKPLKRTIERWNDRDIQRAIAVSEQPKPLDIELPVQMDENAPKMDIRTGYIAKLNKYRWLRIEARAGHSD